MKSRRTPLAAKAAVAACLLVSAATLAFALDPALRKQAKDSDPDRRADAARLLGREGSAEAAQVLAGLFEDRDPRVRDLAVLSCDDLKDSVAVEALAPAARAKDPLTRRNAAAALGRTKQAAALPHIEKLARKDV